MTVCPIALMSGCRKCPVVGMCPLKTVLGDYDPKDDAPAKTTDEAARARYVEAFERSSFFGMMAYYKANYPRPPYAEMPDPVAKVRAPVLQIHGLDDQYLLAGALDGTWEWIDSPYTLVTLPGVGHFVQQDASEAVTRAMVGWLGPAGG